MIEDEAIGKGLAERIVQIKTERGLSLRRLAEISGIPLSTLSKVQNNLATLTYPHLVRLARSLGLEMSELFQNSAPAPGTSRRTVTRADEGLHEATARYRFELLCADLARKAMNPGIMRITARSLDEAGGLDTHDGEEFVYVLKGSLEVLTADYRPTRLETGDSMYLDSTMGHAYVNVGDEPALALAVTTHMIYGLSHL